MAVSEKAKRRDEFLINTAIRLCNEVTNDPDMRSQCLADVLNGIVAEIYWKALEDDNLWYNFVLKIVEEVKKKVRTRG